MSCVQSAMFFLGLSCLVLGTDAKAADFIVPCHIKDSDDCYLSSARKALPYIAEQADPLSLDDINADQGDLKFRLNGCTLEGLKKCTIVELKRSDQFKAALVIECPVKVTGEYIMDGSFLGLLVNGKGAVEIQVDSIWLSINIELKSYTGKDNEEHYKVTKFEYEYEPLTKVHYNFGNLYGGDTAQAEPLVNVLAGENSGKEVLKTVGKPVVKEVVTKLTSFVNLFFKKYASKDIELP